MAGDPYDDAIAENVSQAAVRIAFKGRKGHGGGPIGKRVLEPEELEVIVRSAILVALGQHRQHGGSER